MFEVGDRVKHTSEYIRNEYRDDPYCRRWRSTIVCFNTTVKMYETDDSMCWYEYELELADD